MFRIARPAEELRGQGGQQRRSRDGENQRGGTTDIFRVYVRARFDERLDGFIVGLAGGSQ